MDFLSEMKNRHRHLSDETISQIVDKAKMFYYSFRYPSNPNVDETTHPINGFVAQQWILSACDEIVDRLGISSVIGYQENGLSFTFDSVQLSTTLIKMIKPIVGVIK